MTGPVWEVRWRFAAGEPWLCGYCSQPGTFDAGRRCAGCGRSFDWRSR